MCYDLIQKHEGCRLQAYLCPAGVWTIGWGTTRYPDGTPVKEGDIITQDYADALLTDYLMKEVYPHIARVPYPITLNQKRALCSLIYNIGWPALEKSRLWKSICKKDYIGIFKEWDFGVKQALGLAKRRSEELSLFLGDFSR